MRRPADAVAAAEGEARAVLGMPRDGAHVVGIRDLDFKIFVIIMKIFQDLKFFKNSRIFSS